MDQGFSADEEEIADVVFDADIDGHSCLFEAHGSSMLRIELVDGESTEVTLGIADICDGELKVTIAAVV
jgi:hypothetical protein